MQIARLPVFFIYCPFHIFHDLFFKLGGSASFNKFQISITCQSSIPAYMVLSCNRRKEGARHSNCIFVFTGGSFAIAVTVNVFPEIRIPFPNGSSEPKIFFAAFSVRTIPRGEFKTSFFYHPLTRSNENISKKVLSVYNTLSLVEFIVVNY